MDCVQNHQPAAVSRVRSVARIAPASATLHTSSVIARRWKSQHRRRSASARADARSCDGTSSEVARPAHHFEDHGSGRNRGATAIQASRSRLLTRLTGALPSAAEHVKRLPGRHFTRFRRAAPIRRGRRLRESAASRDVRSDAPSRSAPSAKIQCHQALSGFREGQKLPVMASRWVNSALHSRIRVAATMSRAATARHRAPMRGLAYRSGGSAGRDCVRKLSGRRGQHCSGVRRPAHGSRAHQRVRAGGVNRRTASASSVNSSRRPPTRGARECAR